MTRVVARGREPKFVENDFVWCAEKGIGRVCYSDDNPEYGFCYYLKLDSGLHPLGLVEEKRLKRVKNPGTRCKSGTAETGPTCYALLDRSGRCGNHSCRNYDDRYRKPVQLMKELEAAAAAQRGSDVLPRRASQRRGTWPGPRRRAGASPQSDIQPVDG